MTVLISTAVSGNTDVQVGDPADHLAEALGPPRGRLVRGSIELLVYRRGLVELRQGKVATLDLVSEEEARALELKRERERIQREKAAKERREQLLREGYAEKERVLSDPSFKKRSTRDQVAYWQDFIARYPGVPVHAEYQAAIEQLREEEEIERLRAEEERLQAADPGPKPRVSRQKKRKMQRAGKWKW